MEMVISRAHSFSR